MHSADPPFTTGSIEKDKKAWPGAGSEGKEFQFGKRRKFQKVLGMGCKQNNTDLETQRSNLKGSEDGL